MAKYWVGGTGTWDNSTTTNWSTTSGGSGGAAVPTATDDVLFNASSGSGTCTINASVVCQSIQSSGSSVATLSHNAGFTVSIGSSTAGASNIALDFSGFTAYTLGSATTSAITFVSTSTTVQTVNFNGLTTGNVTYSASSGGSWELTAAHNTGSTATVTLTQGTLNVNGQTCSWGQFISSNTNVRSLTLGTASITITGNANPTWATNTTGGLTISAASSTITLTGSGPVVEPNTFSGYYGTIIMNGGGAYQIGGTGNVTDLTVTGSATKTNTLELWGSLNVTGTLTLSGNSVTNRLLVYSSSTGTARTITCNGTNTISNCDFMDITGAGSASWNLSAITGNSGDCGGNSGITFTTAATQTWSGTSGGNWSTNAWTSRVPLPQDNVVISSAFSANQTITADMPRLGASINWIGATGTPKLALNSVANTIFGSNTFISGMSFIAGQNLTYAGRGSFTITSAGQQHPNGVNITAPGGTYTFQDNFSCAGNLILNYGNMTANANVSANSVLSTVGVTRVITMGGGAWTLTGTGTIWQMASSGISVSGASATIVISNVSSSSRTFYGDGFTYGTLTYNVSGSTGSLIITGSNTFGTINFSDASVARTLQFTSSTTTTITNSFNVNGTSSNLITVNASSAGTAATLSMASGVVACNYLSIQDSTATGGATWYAGANSVNVSDNSGWIFSTAYTSGTFDMMGV